MASCRTHSHLRDLDEFWMISLKPSMTVGLYFPSSQLHTWLPSKHFTTNTTGFCGRTRQSNTASWEFPDDLWVFNGKIIYINKWETMGSGVPHSLPNHGFFSNPPRSRFLCRTGGSHRKRSLLCPVSWLQKSMGKPWTTAWKNPWATLEMTSTRCLKIQPKERHGKFLPRLWIVWDDIPGIQKIRPQLPPKTIASSKQKPY